MLKKIFVLISSLFLYQNIIAKTNTENASVLKTVSAEIAPFIEALPPKNWNTHPKNEQEWMDFINSFSSQAEDNVKQLIKQKNIKIEKENIDNFTLYKVIPNQIDKRNQKKTILHFHGGGYVLNPGISGLDEAILMAENDRIIVYSVDYRMAPKHPFPAAIQDAIKAYQYLLTQYESKNIGFLESSTGGGILFALTLEAKRLNLPLPAVLMAGTPWTDMSLTGDSYYTNEGIDNVLVSYHGWLEEAAKVYANQTDLKNPLLSPIYGDLDDFPPTILFTGTRDLFLSNTIRMHLKLKDAGVKSELIVFEGLSHAQYLFAPDSPESKRYFTENAKFFHFHSN